jgi:predicted transcriptional regulator
MTGPEESPSAETRAVAGQLTETLAAAGRAANGVLVRWLLNCGVPLYSACVLVTLDPDDAPMGTGEVAEAIGIPVEDAHRALRELHSLGYVSEEKRLYRPTEEGRRLHESLTNARRDALAAFLSELRDEERSELIAALKAQGES